MSAAAALLAVVLALPAGAVNGLSDGARAGEYTEDQVRTNVDRYLRARLCREEGSADELSSVRERLNGRCPAFEVRAFRRPAAIAAPFLLTVGARSPEVMLDLLHARSIEMAAGEPIRVLAIDGVPVGRAGGSR